MMIGKFKSTPGWSDTVVCEAEGGRWVIEGEDGDKEDRNVN